MAHIPRDPLNSTRNRKWLEQLDWFKLENYDGLLELTLQQLLEQLLFRINFYLTIEEDEEDSFYIFPNTEEWQSILSGKPIVKIALTSEVKEDNCQCLTQFPGISALTNTELQHYASVTACSEEEPPYIVKAACALDDEFATNLCIECLTLFDEEVNSDFFDENESYITFNELCKGCQFYVDRYNHKQPYHLPFMPKKCNTCNPYTVVFHDSDVTCDDLLLKLNLEAFTDIELMSQFSDLLKESRAILKISEPERINIGKAELYFKNIIRQKIVPYLDIRIWTIYKYVKENDPLREMYEDGLYAPECFQFEHSISIIKKLPFIVFKTILFNDEEGKGEYYVRQQLHQEYFFEYLSYKNINIAQIYLRNNPISREQKVKNIIGLYK
jgi:hypothetical protein